MEPQYYMERCIALAKRGAGKVAPNPMVGAVLVYDDRIIGEGWHQQFGQPHAEVNCITSVKNEDIHLLPKATLYVSLEPCSHYGKTPPCADLIIRERISKVVIGCRDPFEEVNGKGIEKLKAAGIEVVVGVKEDECKTLNERFFTFQLQQRPFVVLKWAETNDGKIANPSTEKNLRLQISNPFSNRLVHKWRSEEAAIMVGTRTALIDNPELTNRLWTGQSPVRVVIDKQLQLPDSLHLFDGKSKTLIFNNSKQDEKGNLLYFKLENKQSCIREILSALYALNIQSVLVEGGTKTLQSFFDDGLWDEARVICNTTMSSQQGLSAPVIKDAIKIEEYKLLSDKITVYKKIHTAYVQDS